MAFEKVNFDEGLENLNETRGGSERTGQRRERQQRQSLNVLGLSGADSLLIGNYGDNEILESFLEIAQKTLKHTKVDIKFIKMDLNKFDFEFSHLVFAYKGDNGKTYYFSTLLEATGRAPLDVHTIVESFNIKNSSDVLVTADGFDDIFFEAATAVLCRAMETKEEDLVFCEGVIMPTGAPLEQTAEIIARYAQDIIVSNYAKDTGIESDITVDAIDAVTENGRLVLDLGLNSGSSINMLGRNVRTDFNVEVSIVKNTSARRLNGQGGRNKLTTTAGYIEYIISEDTDRYTGKFKRMAEPMIILNEFIGAAPTINYALLSMINATTFTNRGVLKNLIVEKDAGPLNFLFNYQGDGRKYGEKISFNDEKASPEIVNDIIREHIVPKPIFALDIEEFGSDYPYLRPFTALADKASRRFATEDILNAASDLVGSEMPDIPVAAATMYVPLGEFLDNESNPRDIREIDTVFIAKHTNDPGLLIDWIYSNAPEDICVSSTGKDPYTLKLEVIDKVATMLNLKPVITGRAVRVVLDGAFIDELTSRAMDGGYTPDTDNPSIGYSEFNNLQNIASAYASASVGSTGFGMSTARQHYSAPHATYNRYRR